MIKVTQKKMYIDKYVWYNKYMQRIVNIKIRDMYINNSIKN